MRTIIYAVSPEGVIGLGGTIPWHYAGDMRRFKRLTSGATVIMGRNTFESIGKPLSNRRNLVVTSRPVDLAAVESVESLEIAVERAGSDSVWFIGGARIYEEAMAYADSIDVTFVPDHVTTAGAVCAPAIDERVFEAGPILPHEDDPALTRRVYSRRPR